MHFRMAEARKCAVRCLASEQVTCLNSSWFAFWESEMLREIWRSGLASQRRLWIVLFAASVSAFPMVAGSAAAEGLSPQQQLAFDIYKELVEINTVTATGDTARAAEAMAARLKAAGFAEA